MALLIFPRISAPLQLFSCRVLHYGLFKVISVITEPFFGSTIICLQIFRGGFHCLEEERCKLDNVSAKGLVWFRCLVVRAAPLPCRFAPFLYSIVVRCKTNGDLNCQGEISTIVRPSRAPPRTLCILTALTGIWRRPSQLCSMLLQTWAHAAHWTSAWKLHTQPGI